MHILGVEHCAKQPHLGDFILRAKPHSIILETSLTREHGAATGNVITRHDQVAGPEAFFFRMFLSMAAALEAEADPAASAVWGRFKDQLFGEQIGYVAAFATGARLVFGDRPKEVTYRRLLHMTNVRELDETFARQSAANYLELITGREPPPDNDSTVERVMMRERDAVLCSSLHAAAQDAMGTGKCVVALVGEAHLPGMQRMWESGEWRELVERGEDEPSCSWQESLWRMPPEGLQEKEQAQLGVKRALLECVVRLRCTERLIQDMTGILGPVPDDHQEAYQSTHEIYSTCRMLMAVLKRELLEQVVSGVDCNFWDVLEPLRKVRPVNGGPGWDADLVLELRGLNFQLD